MLYKQILTFNFSIRSLIYELSHNNLFFGFFQLVLLAAMSSLTRIPIIDFSQPTQSRDKLASEIVNALETVGFLFLDNVIGYDSDLIERATKWFYSLPENTKHSLACKSFNPQNKNVYRGYFPANAQNSSFKEGYEIGEELSEKEIIEIGFPLYERNQWPSGGDEAKWFRDVLLNYQGLMHNTVMDLSRLVAHGLGATETWFDNMFSPYPLSTLRLINYPPRPEPIPDVARDGAYVLHCGGHTDTPFFTLLSTFDYGGLQILDNNDQWLDVPVRRNSLVVNIGDVLSKVTNRKLKATTHRVVDMGIQRQSVAYFLEPRFDVNINRVIGSEAIEEKKEEVCYGTWMLQNFIDKSYVEYIDLATAFFSKR